jgi:concanavalin A-like lectin/glucanase superfamily protein
MCSPTVLDVRTDARVLGLAALLIAMCTTPARAATTLLADWRMDAGLGQAVADASGSGHDGYLGAAPGPDPADPTWAPGGGLDFNGSSYVTVPDIAALEPPHVAVDARVRRAGSPGQWRYVLSKGAVACERSAYGLYSGTGGGMAFYVSSASHYTVSPEAPPALVWDGEWHHVMGYFDGARVRLWVDGVQVGAGTPTSAAIGYGTSGKGVYLGTYRGSCDLPFTGSVDDVRIWDGMPPNGPATGPSVPPVPGTPSRVEIRGHGLGREDGAEGGGSAGCLTVRLNRRTVPVGRRARLVATVRRARQPVARARVLARGAGVRASALTGRRGTARIVVHARRRGALKVRIGGEPSSCRAASVRAR